MTVTGKWQGNMCSHLHYQARKHSTVGVFLHYHCTSIHRTVHLSMTPPLVGPRDGSRTPKGEMQPHALLCFVALHCSRLLISHHDSHTAWGAVQFYFTQRWIAFHTNLFTAELRFPAGVCQGCLKGMGTLAKGFSIQWYSAKSMKDFAWQEQGVTPRPWLFSM